MTATTLFQLATKIPVTLAIGLTAMAIACVPGLAETLQFDRAEIVAGNVSLLATGHLTHWNVEHIQWDLLMFLVLGAACEIRNPKRMRWCVAAAAASVSMLVFFFFPEIETYRGLSGIDTALFTLLGIDLMRDAWSQRNRMLAVVAGGLLFGFVAKTAYEAVTGHALFVDQQAAGFELLVWDHIVASVAGLCVALTPANRLSPLPVPSPLPNPPRRGEGAGRSSPL